MQDELRSLGDTNTWTLLERPKDKNVVQGNWVYKVKTRAERSLENFKALYVAKCFKGFESYDYWETVAPTSKRETFWLILSLIAKKNFILRQKDVKVASFHPKIKDEFHLEQLSAFENLNPFGQRLVCRLIKSSYGLKQAAKNCYEELANFLIEQIFVHSENDYCLFSKNGKGKELSVLIWVDDLVIAGKKFGRYGNFAENLRNKVQHGQPR